MKELHHLGFSDSQGAKYALMPGDPDRVEKIARQLENPRFYHRKREYTTWLGELEGETVMVISTGMGGPAAAICAEELHQIGVETMIRIGGCGGMQLHVMPGDLVIASGSIRAEGTTREYVPIEFPAVAHPVVTNALVCAAQELKYPYHLGIVHCKDSFYGQLFPERMPVSFELQNRWNAWKMAGTLGSEMESAALFITAQCLGMRVGCILNAAVNQERELSGFPDEQQPDMTKAIKVAVEALRQLIRLSK